MINDAEIAEKAALELRTKLNSTNNLSLLLEQQIIPKLIQLTEESTSLRARCNAPDYDGTGVSIERSAM